MPRLLALDFDGVISDSAPESFTVALLTYLEFVPGSSIRGRPNRYSTRRAVSHDAVRRDELYRGFLELMPLGNRAEDFGVVLRALEERTAIRDQHDYDRFRESVGAEWQRAFHTRFYQVRAELAASDPDGWIRLMPAYPGFVEILRRRSRDVTLAIATAKDRRSVEQLLANYGIGDLFSPDRLLDKETGVHKDRHIERLHESFGVPFAEIAFIDDKLNHLEVVGRLGARCGLAAWGYNGAREIEQARRAGYPVFEIADVESGLMD